MNRLKLGTWTLPTGNSVDAYLVGDGVGPRGISCKWDTLPLSDAELTYYVDVVAPQLSERAREALGVEGGLLWVLA